MFLVSQSYPSTDPNLPTSFTIQGLPGGDVLSAPVVAADGSVSIHSDLSAVAPGSYSITATATNSAGTSDVAASPPLALTIAPPVQIPTAPVLSTSET